MSRQVRDMGPIVNGQYPEFQYDVNQSIDLLGKLNIDIYTDGSGNNYALDTKGNPIQNRVIIEMAYTYPYTDPMTQTFYDGYFTITFDDGSSLSNVDSNDTAYWYYIEGLEPVVIKQFT